MFWGQESRMCSIRQKSRHLQLWALWRLQGRMNSLPFLESRLCPFPGFGCSYQSHTASSGVTFFLCSQAPLCLTLMKTLCPHLGPDLLVQDILPTLISLINQSTKIFYHAGSIYRLQQVGLGWNWRPESTCHSIKVFLCYCDKSFLQ